MVRLLLICAAALLAGPCAAWQVIDGDTLRDGDVTYRLEGIDAPELGQTCGTAGTRRWPCGNEAKEWLAGWLDGRQITCRAQGADGYGRIIATCFADGQDIGERLVRDGRAWAFVRYSQTYIDVEKEAIFAQRGIWSVPSQKAWDYREERWTEAAQAAPDGCPIKGNISDNGRIYHAPWSPWYNRTRINTAKGERWFCSEAEALAAGWRAPRW